MGEDASEEERTNAETRLQLIKLNSSLFLSESMDHIDLLIPMDTIEIGKNLTKYLEGYKADLLFH